MRTLLISICIVLTAFAVVQAQTTPITPADTTVETLVCVRHGEKPAAGLGQLTCRGLNRALALPKVLLGKFATPQFIFAPNPTEKSEGGKYDYVRPLVTIEPTAIRCGLPVNTDIGAKEISDLESELQKEPYHNSTVYIAWEHSLLDTFAQNMVKNHGGGATKVPAWPSDDFDTIFVIKITRSHGQESTAFTIEHEGLNSTLTDDCPEK